MKKPLRIYICKINVGDGEGKRGEGRGRVGPFPRGNYRALARESLALPHVRTRAALDETDVHEPDSPGKRIIRSSSRHCPFPAITSAGLNRDQTRYNSLAIHFA